MNYMTIFKMERTCMATLSTIRKIQTYRDTLIVVARTGSKLINTRENINSASFHKKFRSGNYTSNLIITC